METSYLFPPPTSPSLKLVLPILHHHTNQPSSCADDPSDISKAPQHQKLRKNALLNVHRGNCRLRQRRLCSVQLHQLLQRRSSDRRVGGAIELVPCSAEHLPRDLPKRSDLSQQLRSGTSPPVTNVNQLCLTGLNRATTQLLTCRVPERSHLQLHMFDRAYRQHFRLRPDSAFTRV